MQLSEFPDYDLSPEGIVVHIPSNTTIKPRKNTKGYQVTLFNSGKKYVKNLTNLLAATYLPEPRGRYVIPKDGNWFNLSIDNLVYSNRKDSLNFLSSGILTQEAILAIFEYNPITGIWYRLRTGKEVGYLTGSKPNQYLTVEINYKPYKLHRLAFLYMEGYMPNYVDHIDHNTLNNTWSNLRDVSSKENCQNRSKGNNSSGVLGVVRTANGNYLARITVDYNCICLGTFKTLEEAAQARKEAEKLYGFHENHGS